MHRIRGGDKGGWPGVCYDFDATLPTIRSAAITANARAGTSNFGSAIGSRRGDRPEILRAEEPDAGRADQEPCHRLPP